VSPVADSEGAVVRRRFLQRTRAAGRVVSWQALVATTALGFDNYERSAYLGEPVELYKFVYSPTTQRYTSTDRNITVTGDGTYAAEAISRDPIDFTNEDTASTITIRVPRTNAVAQLFVNYLPTVPVGVTIYSKHRNDPEVRVRFVGKVVSASFEDPAAALVCAPISQVLRRKIPSIVFQSHCNWPLYGGGCGVAKASFKDSGTVLSQVGSVVRAAVFATRPDGWYENGWVQITSGVQNGQRRFVVRHVGDAVTVMNPFSVIGLFAAAIDGFAGCDRTEATCVSKFANLVNHMGWPRIPTRNPFGQSLDDTGGAATWGRATLGIGG